MAVDQGTGATAHDFSSKRYGGVVRGTPLSTVAIGVGVTRIVTNNPRRVGVIVVNQGTASVFVGWDTGLTINNGIFLAPLGGSIILDVTEDGEMVAWEMFGVAGAVGNNVSVIEIVRQ